MTSHHTTDRGGANTPQMPSHHVPALWVDGPLSLEERLRVVRERCRLMADVFSIQAEATFLACHVSMSADAYNALIAGYHGPAFKVGEFLLLGAVIYHSLNGLRIVLIDFVGWSPNQKRLFWTLGAVAFVLFAVGGYPSIAALVDWAASR